MADQELHTTNIGNHLFPVFLKMEELELLIVGAGNVGYEKLTAILYNSPSSKVTVVAKEISTAVKDLVRDYPGVNLFEREFREEDLISRDLVIIAVNDSDTSRKIREVARLRRLLVNVADTPGLCDFYLGSIVQKGDVKIAISTNGKSPTLAKRIKDVLNEALPSELHELASNLNLIRNQLKGNLVEKIKYLNQLTTDLISGEKTYPLK